MQLPPGWDMGTDANGRTYCEFHCLAAGPVVALCCFQIYFITVVFSGCLSSARIFHELS